MSALDQVRDTFFQECDELLEELQEGLLAISDQSADSETIHGVFRAVHSIKGGAAAFGFDHLVRFAHEFETLLDAIRNDEVKASESVIGVLLVACDRLGDLVIAAREDATLDAAKSDALIAELLEFLPKTEMAADTNGGNDETADFAPVTLSLDLDIAPTNETAPTKFLISFHPHSALYRNGNETAFLFRSLRELGPLKVACDATQLPQLQLLEPEVSYLSWKIELETCQSEADILDVFEFVIDDCDLAVLASDSECETQPAMPFLETDDKPLPLLQKDTAPEHEPEPDSSEPPTAEPNKLEQTAMKSVGNAGGAKPSKPDAAPVSRGAAVTVRVDVTRIDQLINLVSELVMNQAMLAQYSSELNISAASEFATGLDELKQLSREIQDSVMAIRAQPVKSLFQRMFRIVREAAAATNKKVRLDVIGEMTEVDKTVIEKLADPLTHMIRNAVDHGLETSAERLAAGKPEEGRVQLSAAHRSGRIVIEVSDDGGGINRDRVRQIAVEKGLISADEILSVEETDALLFRPGFSTVSNVSNLSGRGVGMDVVNNAIRALSGRITIRSNPGTGSTFSISLPLTLAVLDGMIVEVEQQWLVIPITAIIEMLRPEPGSVRKLSHDSNVIFVHDTYVPVLDVGHFLGYRDRTTQTDNRVFVLVETDNGAKYAILVDAIHDQRQVVIKSLETNYGKVPGIAAATVLGDGRTALILDPNDEFFDGTANSLVGAPLVATG